MQVLQRIDLFTDTGLKEQLAHHLQPIVERANAELVEAINEHVGKLMRSYIAEAIEREIAQWRRDNR
jgi:transcriptional antiterminator